MFDLLCLYLRSTLVAVLSTNLNQQLVRDDVLNSYIFILHSFDLWPNSETQKHFQTWHPHVRHTSRNTISMDAKFYSILPSKMKISLFCLNGLPTRESMYTVADTRYCGILYQCIWISCRNAQAYVYEDTLPIYLWILIFSVPAPAYASAHMDS